MPAHPPIVGRPDDRAGGRAGTASRVAAGLPLNAALHYGLAAITAAIQLSVAGRGLRLRTAFGFLGVLACLALSSEAHAQHVRGRLEGFKLLQNPVWAEARDPKHHGYSFREPVPTVRAEFRRLYPHIPKEVCVAALAATPQKPPATAILIRVGGGRTTPVTIVVAPGTKLTFQNTDPFRHRLYAVGQKMFSPNDTLQGATREWTVPEAGTFEIRDEAAPSLRMWVVADPHVAAVAYPSMKGEFSLTLENPGEYRVQAFFAGKRVGPEIPATLAAADIDISKTPLRLVDEKAAAKAAKDEAEGVAEKQSETSEAKPDAAGTPPGADSAAPPKAEEKK
jgi:plastocyanin